MFATAAAVWWLLFLQDIHYTVDEKQRNVLLTEDGYEAVEDVLQVGQGAQRANLQPGEGAVRMAGSA